MLTRLTRPSCAQLPAKCRLEVWGKGGQIDNVVLVEGRIVGTWRYAKSKSLLTLTVKPLSHAASAAVLADQHVRTAVRKETELLARFFALPASTVEFA